jgi:AraC family ethanolamine operon transcriptional activator
MDQVSSARINGRRIERSLLLISGVASCTVYEPEGRLVAIVSIRKAALERDWQSLEDDHLLLELPKERLEALQLTVRHLLERAAHEPEAVRTPAALGAAEQLLLVELDQAMRAGKIVLQDGLDYLSRYHEIVEKIDLLLRSDPGGEMSGGELAGAMGISKRTLHNAVQRICGHSPNRYVRVRRLWMVRNQLCSGASGLTVKSSARAHGFRHMGEFSETYKSTFGEMPSKTLDDARDPTINPINDSYDRVLTRRICK